MSGMAEVLAAHQWYDATTDNEDPATGCTGCPDWFGSEDALDDGTFAAHQAAMLTAAGFGPVKESGAVAPHLKKVRGELKSFGKNLDSWESQGHTTVTIRNLRQVVARMDAAIRGNVA